MKTKDYLIIGLGIASLASALYFKDKWSLYSAREDTKKEGEKYRTGLIISTLSFSVCGLLTVRKIYS